MQKNAFFEMLPLVAFFGVYYFTRNIFLSTGVCIVASWAQLLFCKIKFRHVSRNTWISTLLITCFGGLTVIFHNKTFIMIKPTVLFGILGISLLIGQVAGKNGMKILLSKELQIRDAIWNGLNIAWGLFFITMAAINLFVALNFSEYIWVKFKVFGTLGSTLVFTLISAVVLLANNKKAPK